MNIRENFKEKIGCLFELEAQNNYPDYALELEPSAHVALIDVTKFTKVKEWKPFVMAKIPLERGYLTHNGFGYNAVYVKKAIEVLKPHKYAFYKDYTIEFKEYSDILAFKRGDYGILIAPAFPGEDITDIIPFESLLKKIAKSVFVL